MTTHDDTAILKALRALRTLGPTENFLLRSRALLLGIPPESAPPAKTAPILFLRTMLFKAAFSFASFALIGTVTGIIYWSATRVGSSAEKKLLIEANALDFQIELEYARYFDETAKDVTVALRELLEETGKTEQSFKPERERVPTANEPLNGTPENVDETPSR